jgi:hypothetical protein
MSTALGIAASQNPQTAAGVRTGMGGFSMLQGLTDKRNVAEALASYSETVDKDVKKEMLDRGVNEAVISAGADRPTQLGEGGPFIMGGPAPTTFGGTSAQELERHAAAVRALPAVGAANPQGAGYVLADLARQAPTPGPAKRQPSLYQMKQQLETFFPGHNLSANMSERGVTVSATAPKPEGDPPKEPAQFTKEELGTARESLSGLPEGVTESISVLGPQGAKRTVTGRGAKTTGGGPVGGGMIQVSIGGTEFLYNEATGEYMPIPQEVLDQFAEVQAIRENEGIAGTVIRNKDGTLTVRR